MVRAEKDSGRHELFDDWADRYDSWFTTPVGRFVKKYETELLLEMLQPKPHDLILDVGCGTAVFTLDVLSFGTTIFGLDISYPMLVRAQEKTVGHAFQGTVGNMSDLPFADETFDKVYSMTAVEFVEDAERAIMELHRVVRGGGEVVLTTLNSLSPWAERRTGEAARGHSLFQSMVFRSPNELAELCPGNPTVRTAIHFLKEDDPGDIPAIEEQGRADGLDTGAFVAASWRKKG